MLEGILQNSQPFAFLKCLMTSSESLSSNWWLKDTWNITTQREWLRERILLLPPLIAAPQLAMLRELILYLVHRVVKPRICIYSPPSTIPISSWCRLHLRKANLTPLKSWHFLFRDAFSYPLLLSLLFKCLFFFFTSSPSFCLHFLPFHRHMEPRKKGKYMIVLLFQWRMHHKKANRLVAAFLVARLLVVPVVISIMVIFIPDFTVLVFAFKLFGLGALW